MFNLNNLIISPGGSPLIYAVDSGKYLCVSAEEAAELCRHQAQNSWLAYYKNLKNARPELQQFILDCLTPHNKNQKYTPFQVSVSFLGEAKCNLRCAYCFNQDTPQNNSLPFSEKLFRKTLERFYKQKSGWPAVDFGYAGEPLLHFTEFKQLYAINQELAKKYKKPAATLGIMTNGLLLNDNILDWLEEHNCWIGLSLDGGAELTNASRGNGVFEKALANYKNIFKRDSWIKYQRSVSATISALNPDVYRVFCELWAEGFRQIYMKPVRAGTDSPYALKKDLLPQIQDSYKELFALFAEELANERTDKICAMLNRFDYAGRFLCRIIGNSQVTKRCGAANGTLSIRNNGDVYPCDTYAVWQKHKLGNIYRWFSWRKNFVPSVNNIPQCRACTYRYICSGPCRVWQEQNHGDFSFECALNKFLIEQCFQFAAILEDHPQQKQYLRIYIKHHLEPYTYKKDTGEKQ